MSCAFTAYAAPCQRRGSLQRKVATYLPLSSFWNVRAHPSDSALKGSPAPTNSPNQKDFQPVPSSRTSFFIRK
ncbi:hypothetical protein BDA96_01G398400 [Sorghum bicolor]|uniref:Uncharacterized protein n=2 Tax=Sorghum bicolor TaxID=4558 RepID=A0A921S624_SORBI|nr:hypothetical protein SORBI_3001G374500 [Sorghum bicolor]KAG0551152.1 hypothetical protein BDA96_01G398400 [Sorghum bicolor]